MAPLEQTKFFRQDPQVIRAQLDEMSMGTEERLELLIDEVSNRLADETESAKEISRFVQSLKDTHEEFESLASILIAAMRPGEV